MNYGNRIMRKDDLTFFQWLNIYESITKKEFKDLPDHKKEDYKKKFELFKNK